MAESSQLREAAAAAQGEGDRQAAEMAQTRQSLQAAQAPQQALLQCLDTERAAAQHLRGDLEARVSALPPNPRRAQVRVARFVVKGDGLDYKLVVAASTAPARRSPARCIC